MNMMFLVFTSSLKAHDMIKVGEWIITTYFAKFIRQFIDTMILLNDMGDVNLIFSKPKNKRFNTIQFKKLMFIMLAIFNSLTVKISTSAHAKK